MKYKKNEWRQHIAMSKSCAFRRADRDLVIKLFTLDLDDEIKHASDNDDIEIVCRWRNIGDAFDNPKNPNFSKFNKEYTHEIHKKQKYG